ncbi:Acidic phosphoprotein precursor PCEMA1, putative, partial [Plasmodium berghei]
MKYAIYGSDQYNELINELWDPDNVVFINTGSIKIVRVYNPNLVMVQQRYKNPFSSVHKYFYALSAKFEVSKNKTVLVMASADINDHNLSTEPYQNTIVESANLFKTDIDSEDDIRKGKLKKTFINIAGYLIEKKDGYSDITYIESVGCHAPISLKLVRVYNPNLVMVQQRYKNPFSSVHKYFYALSAKFEVSKNKTVLVMASADINDHNLSTEPYQNTIVESANLFKTDIDSEDDIRKGKLKKTFINIAGYLIEKKDGYSDITYIES